MAKYTSKDNIKCKILLSEKYIEEEKEFNVKYIVSKDILNCNEDLIAFVEVLYKKDTNNRFGVYHSTTAQQVKIPLKDYKEYDEDNICYEVNLCVPSYSNYLDHLNTTKQPKLNMKGYFPLSQHTYSQKSCNVGLMRESQLDETRLPKIIKRKEALFKGQLGTNTKIYIVSIFFVIVDSVLLYFFLK